MTNRHPIPDEWHGQTATPIDPADAFNGYVAANVVFALDRVGLLEPIGRGESVSVPNLAAILPAGADPPRVIAVLRAAADCGYLKATDGVFTPTEAGRDMARSRGYFTWAVGGYHEVFANAGQLSLGERRYVPGEVHREESMVALGSAQVDQSMFASLLDEVLAGVEFQTLADLGSGNCARVSRVVAARPGTRGVGIDISAPATEMARRDVAAAGLADRVQAVHADVLDIIGAAGRPDGVIGDREVDTVMSFFLLHDLLASRASRSAILPRMREAFPKARTFVFGDTMLRASAESQSRLPVFSIAFELAHALMGIELHTKETYEDLFAAAGMRVGRVEPFSTPQSWLYVLHAD
ncbi:MAG TPA: class I SAM-dependent methyltransferase [Streptosporangiaceae bacterium]|nr:class I SAM-dependent methyltransferase [Streptosporangiaceae bacterium]